MKFLQSQIWVSDRYIINLKKINTHFAAPSFPANISTLRTGSIKWKTRIALITTLVIQDWSQRYILVYVYRSLGSLSLFKVFNKLFLNLYQPPWLGKIFEFMVFQLLEKCIFESKNWIYTFLFIPLFTHRLLLSPLRQRKITLSSQAGICWRSIFPSLKKGDYVLILCMNMGIQELNYLII